MSHWTSESVEAICVRLRDVRITPTPTAEALTPAVTAAVEGVQVEPTLTVQHTVDGGESTLQWWWSMRTLADGSIGIDAQPGLHASPTITLDATAETAAAIRDGVLAPSDAFLIGSMSISGMVDTALANLQVLKAVLAQVTTTTSSATEGAPDPVSTDA